MEADHCDRCGRFAEGRRQWMFHQDRIGREFFCVRCQKILRIYAWIGLSLLMILLAGFCATVWWLTRLR